MNNRLSLISLELERVLVSVLSYYKERCRGLALGIIGRSAAARSLATRRLAFKISVLYFDVEVNGKVSRSYGFPSAARKMDTLNDLLAASDLISLHCALTNETIQILNAECLQHVKAGAFLVNTGSYWMIVL